MSSDPNPIDRDVVATAPSTVDARVADLEAQLTAERTNHAKRIGCYRAVLIPVSLVLLAFVGTCTHLFMEIGQSLRKIP